MSEAWSQWEGQVIDGRFELKQCLAASGQRAVYLTQICSRDRSGPEPIPLAIKLIAADPAHAARQLSRWRLAQILSHPNLLRVFDAGRCRLGSDELIFGVLEYADENLAQIIPQRPLTVEEARQMLEPTLEALAYLHEQGLVHGALKPANVMAMVDAIKLASDWISPAEETVSDPRILGPYDAPETASGNRSPASDVWSLGMVLSEALTQRLPSWNGRHADSNGDPRLPADLPAPFAEIVRGCLRRDVSRRPTVAEIGTLLYGDAPRPAPAPVIVVAQSAAVSIASPVSHTAVAIAALPAVQEPATRTPEAPAPTKPTASEVTPAVRKPIVSEALPAPQKLAVGSTIAPSPVVAPLPVVMAKDTASKSFLASFPRRITFPGRAGLADWISWMAPLIRRFALPLGVALAALVTLYAALGLMHREPSPAGVPSPKTEQHAAPAVRPRPASLRSGVKPSPRVSPNGGGRAGVAEDIRSNAVSAPTAAPDAADSARDSAVVQQVLPHASQSALATITGTIRISVRVKVDSAGNVSDASLISSGPSQYFARLSLQAAQDWKFDPSRAGGRPFLLRFEFRSSGSRAFATRSN